MKKMILMAVSSLLLCSCGVGTYSLSSGKQDEGMISFVCVSKTPVIVTIDDNTYSLHTVKTKAWRRDRKIKKTAKNTIFLAPGQHDVVVMSGREVIFRKKLFISTREHKIVEL